MRCDSRKIVCWGLDVAFKGRCLEATSLGFLTSLTGHPSTFRPSCTSPTHSVTRHSALPSIATHDPPLLCDTSLSPQTRLAVATHEVKGCVQYRIQIILVSTQRNDTLARVPLLFVIVTDYFEQQLESGTASFPPLGRIQDVNNWR